MYTGAKSQAILGFIHVQAPIAGADQEASGAGDEIAVFCAEIERFAVIVRMQGVNSQCQFLRFRHNRVNRDAKTQDQRQFPML